MIAKKLFVYPIIFLFLLAVTPTKAQISNGGIPFGFRESIIELNTEIIEMPEIDSTIIKEQLTEPGTNRLKSFSIGFTFNVNINTSNHGDWRTINGFNVWSLKIRSQGAKAIGIVFNNYSLKPDEKIFIYTKNEVLGAYNFKNNLPSKTLAITPIEGEIATIEFSTPYNKENQGSFNITKIGHLYKSFDKTALYNFQDPDTCNININCIEGNKWKLEKQAVCKLMIYGNGLRLCTGTLINNTENNAKSYIITANHCVNENTIAAQTVFYFNHESANCKSNIPIISQSLSGSTVRSTLFETDFSLLELYSHPPVSYKPYFAGWSTEADKNLDTLVAIHHPWGGVKKIAVSYTHPITDTYVDGTDPAPRLTNGFWRVPHWNRGITEDGSSGGALFDRNHRIIGTLTGGPARCTSPFDDVYEKFSISYNIKTLATEKMNYYLNPNNMVITYLNGFDPYPNAFTDCDTNSNILKNEIVKQLPYEYGTGFYTGHNSAKITDYAEKFYSKDSCSLSGILIYIGKTGSTGGLIMRIQKGTTVPESTLYESFIPYKEMINNIKNYVEIYPNISVIGNYFVTYSITYSNSDTFTVFQASPRYMETDINTAYLKIGNTWNPFNKYNSHWATSLDISTITTPIKATGVKQTNYLNNISLYPCPAKNNIIFSIPENLFKIQKIEACDLSGKIVALNFTKNNSNNQINANISNLKEGIYFLKIQTLQTNYSSKFIKVK
jgi:lysyl endopeptidase